MAGKPIDIAPLAVALRGQQGSVALFACDLPARHQGDVVTWATCGQRKRFPVRARIVADRAGERRALVVKVVLPPFYTACTLHALALCDGRPAHASCRIENEQFRELAPASSNPENDPGYHERFLARRPGDDALAAQREAQASFAFRPLISIVTPTFNTPEPFLRDMIESVLAQTYDEFELVLVDVSDEAERIGRIARGYGDERIRVLRAPNCTIPENTNVGIEAARGDYVAFVDHDDFIEPDALFRYVEAINAQPESDLLFCDEDLWVERDGTGSFCGARLKPGWDHNLALTHNCVCHMLMVSRWALERVELSGPDVNGAQDYDLTFKVAEVARHISHVPQVLYHWRDHEGSSAMHRESKPYLFEAGRRAVQEHLDRIGVAAQVGEGASPLSYRVRYEAAPVEKATVILLEEGACSPIRCSGAVQGEREVEIIAAGEDSLNAAVRSAAGEVVAILDHSVDVEGEWLDELAGQLALPGNGCASPLLVDWRGIVQAAGFARNPEGAWSRRFGGYPSDDVGYMLMLDQVHEVEAVPLRCLVFRRADFERAGGFDDALAGDAKAIGFCEKLREAGLATVVVPQVTATLSNELGFPASSALYS